VDYVSLTCSIEPVPNKFPSFSGDSLAKFCDFSRTTERDSLMSLLQPRHSPKGLSLKTKNIAPLGAQQIKFRPISHQKVMLLWLLFVNFEPRCRILSLTLFSLMIDCSISVHLPDIRPFSYSQKGLSAPVVHEIDRFQTHKK